MRVILEVPEDIARALASGPQSLDRAALEALAAEGYRCGLLSESQVMRWLNLASRFAVHDWLRERQIPFRYTETDLADDMSALSDLGLR
jgi:hypothetical protein